MWLQTASVAALAKPSGGIRPLSVLPPFRRLALAGLVAQHRDALRAAAGGEQYGLGTKGGADVQFKTLQAAVHARPDAVLIAVDVRNAFGCIRRDAV
eukprot:10561553-Alexandrium_andersonii.AAC.1